MIDNGQFTVLRYKCVQYKFLTATEIMTVITILKEMKNRLKMEHVYLNRKRKLEAKPTHCSSSIHPTAFIFKQYSDPSDWKFEQINVGLPSVYFSFVHNLYSMH